LDIFLEDKKIEVSDKDKAHVITEDISHSKAEMKPDDVKNSSTTVASVTVKEELSTSKEDDKMSVSSETEKELSVSSSIVEAYVSDVITSVKEQEVILIMFQIC
jgi:hypothetical protein